MIDRFRFALVLHRHQAIRPDAELSAGEVKTFWQPLLDLFEKRSHHAINLHLSGAVWESLTAHRKRLVRRIREAVQRGQFELIGGAFYDPVLSAIPRRDRQGQVVAFQHFLDGLMNVKPGGLWLPGKVWQKSFAADLARVGVKYVILDDSMFADSTLLSAAMHSYAMVEDEGCLLRAVPDNRQIGRSLFRDDPKDTAGLVQEFARRHPGSLLVCSVSHSGSSPTDDNAENQFDPVWLERFLDCLDTEASGIRCSRISPALDLRIPMGFFEPCGTHAVSMKSSGLIRVAGDEGASSGSGWPSRFERLEPSDVHWQLHARAIEVSNRLLQANRADLICPAQLQKAARNLYRAQSICYPSPDGNRGLDALQVRMLAYRYLIASENLIAAGPVNDAHPVEALVGDWNLDARQEVRLSNDRLAAYLSPACGGHLYEVDLRRIELNVVAPAEPNRSGQHLRVFPNPSGDVRQHDNPRPGDAVPSDVLRESQPRCLADHLMLEDATVEDLRRTAGGQGDFIDGVFDAVIERLPRRTNVRLTRSGRFQGHPVHLVKTVSLEAGSEELEIRYEFRDLPREAHWKLAVEFNFGGFSGVAGDSYFYDERGCQLGPVELRPVLDAQRRFGLTDERQGFDATFEFGCPATIWTVSSAGRTGPSSELARTIGLAAVWQLQPDRSGRWENELTLSFSTAAAAARHLTNLRRAPGA